LAFRYIGGTRPFLPTATRARRQAAIGLLGGGDDDVRAGNEHRLVAGLEGDDRRVIGHDDGLLAVFVFERHPSPARVHRHRVGNGRIGHHAPGLEIPGIVALIAAAHRLGEQKHLECELRSVGLRHARDSNEGAGLDLADVGFGDRGDQIVLGELHGEHLAGARFYLQVEPVERRDVAADALRRQGCLRERRRAQPAEQIKRERRSMSHSIPPAVVLPSWTPQQGGDPGGRSRVLETKVMPAWPFRVGTLPLTGLRCALFQGPEVFGGEFKVCVAASASVPDRCSVALRTGQKTTAGHRVCDVRPSQRLSGAPGASDTKPT